MKLIKKEETYYLVIPGESTNEFIASVDGLYVKHKLSIKNCEAIERGYDLDKLAEELIFDKLGVSESEEDYLYSKTLMDYYEEGFQKALEILGDKKYTYNDVQRAFIQGAYAKTEIHRKKEEYMQSLQQSEWNVELEMEEVLYTSEYIPILDEERCLILKRS